MLLNFEKRSVDDKKHEKKKTVGIELIKSVFVKKHHKYMVAGVCHFIFSSFHLALFRGETTN